ncbi:MAG: dihydroneopterin aldolase [Verrucomicrobiota bacterium]
MSRISVVDLEVSYHIGITDEERATPQRLLVTIDMDFDFSSAALSDRLEKTVNYQALADRVLKFGEGRNWRLLEKLVTNLADAILIEFRPLSVTVEVKKFPIPQAKYVSVTLTRSRAHV